METRLIDERLASVMGEFVIWTPQVRLAEIRETGEEVRGFYY